MSREIPLAVKDQAFRLWLQGESYRRICSETGMSMGALSAHINELRKRAPDIDQLRELNVVLRRGGFTVFDALRGGRLLDEVGWLGVSLDELESYVKLSARISPKKGVEAERFVESSMRLMSLEAKTGKNYEQLLKDFEERTKQIEGLEMKAKGLQEENRKLMERKAELEGEIREAKERRSIALQELNHIITTQERLQKLGLERVSDLARFIEDFELLGFDTNMVRKLASWRKSLAEMDINPDKLGEFIKKKGSLEKQLDNLTREKIAREQKAKELKGEHLRLWNQMTSLRDEVSRLFSLSLALKEGRLTLPCKVCRMQGVRVLRPVVQLHVLGGRLVRGSACYASNPLNERRRAEGGG